MRTATIEHEPTAIIQQARGATMPIPVPASEDAAVVGMIERAARDPSVDIDKLRQLIEMRSQIEAKAAERAFDLAMTAAQTDIRPVAADCTNPQTRSKYASYPALDRALRPVYTRNGFSLSFNTHPGAADGFVRVTCRVSHKGGHSREYEIDMPSDGKGAKGNDVMTKTHATGSAVSYGMRYLLKMVFNVSVGDDDGNGASDTGSRITAEEAETVRDMLAAAGADEAKFLRWARVERIEDIPAARYDACVRAIQARAGGPK